MPLLYSSLTQPGVGCARVCMCYLCYCVSQYILVIRGSSDLWAVAPNAHDLAGLQNSLLPSVRGLYHAAFLLLDGNECSSMQRKILPSAFQAIMCLYGLNSSTEKNYCSGDNGQASSPHSQTIAKEKVVFICIHASSLQKSCGFYVSLTPRSSG